MEAAIHSLFAGVVKRKGVSILLFPTQKNAPEPESLARAAPPAPLATQESRPQVRNSDPALLAAAGTLGAGLGPGDRAQHLP